MVVVVVMIVFIVIITDNKYNYFQIGDRLKPPRLVLEVKRNIERFDLVDSLERPLSFWAPPDLGCGDNCEYCCLLSLLLLLLMLS